MQASEEKTATKNPPADFVSILQQVDDVFKERFDCKYVQLSGYLTADQLAELNAKIESKVSLWKPVTYTEYKAEYDRRQSAAEGISAELLSEYQFEKLNKKENVCKWGLQVTAVEETEEFIEFVVTQLRTNRLHALQLKQVFSVKAIDRILQACRYSSLQIISFAGKKQILSDAQAKVLLECIARGRLNDISEFNGKNLLDETAERFAAIVAKECSIDMIHCFHFDMRSRIEKNLQNYSNLHDAGNYRADDIKKLSQKLTNLPEQLIEFHLKTHFIDPEWAAFFTAVLGSTTNVVRLVVSSYATVSEQVLLAILQSLGINTTIKQFVLEESVAGEASKALVTSLHLNTTLTSIALALEDKESIPTILQALSTHPMLVELSLSGSKCAWQGVAFKNLLTHAKKLQTLNLVKCKIDAHTMQGLAMGLVANRTILKLDLSHNTLTELSLYHLGWALARNGSLTQLSFKMFPNHGIQELEMFLILLQLHNYSLIEIDMGLPWLENFDQRINDNQKLLTCILQRNKDIALEKRQQQRQYYIAIVILFLQAMRQNHPVFMFSFILDSVLSFLTPSLEIASAEQTKRCTNLLRFNLSKHTWKTEVETEKKNDSSKIIGKFTIFKKWSAPSKHEIESENCKELAHLRVSKYLEDKRLSYSRNTESCVIS
jgi:hypothetical protein